MVVPPQSHLSLFFCLAKTEGINRWQISLENGIAPDHLISVAYDWHGLSEIFLNINEDH